MIRLVIYIAVFAGGLWAGAEYQRVTAVEDCLNAGGSADPRGFCVAPD
ncbi:hypothetical protein [Meridianimarinicoccus roseus]|jgi:hypothetical protein|nr:hypothetical protein [Meridianimarinicoccus roseus]